MGGGVGLSALTHFVESVCICLCACVWTRRGRPPPFLKKDVCGEKGLLEGAYPEICRKSYLKPKTNVGKAPHAFCEVPLKALVHDILL